MIASVLAPRSAGEVVNVDGRLKGKRQREEHDDVSGSDIVQCDHRVDLGADEVATEHRMPKRVDEKLGRNLGACFGEDDDAACRLEPAGNRVEIGRGDVEVGGFSTHDVLRVHEAHGVARRTHRRGEVCRSMTEARALFICEPDRGLKLPVAVVAQRLGETHDRGGVDADALGHFAQRGKGHQFRPHEKGLGEPLLLAGQPLEPVPDLFERRVPANVFVAHGSSRTA